MEQYEQFDFVTIIVIFFLSFTQPYDPGFWIIFFIIPFSPWEIEQKQE